MEKFNIPEAEQEIAFLAAEVDRLRKERDANRAELDALKENAEKSISAQLRLLSVDLAKDVQNNFYSQLRWIGGLIAVGLTVATAGGFFTLSNMITSVVDKQVKERVKESDDDIKSLRTSMIKSLADFTLAANKALSDIDSATGRVRQAGEQAEREISIRVATAVDLPTATREQSNALLTAEISKIRVVVHVIYRLPEENISDDQIKSQIVVLDDDYRAKNKDISKVPEPFKPFIGDARIKFSLATSDPFGRPTTGITRTKTNRPSFSSDDKVKSVANGGADAWDADRYLNIWVATLGNGILEYAQFPGGPTTTDGVVILNRAFGTVGTVQAPFDKGRSTTVAVARYLNVRHIWGDRNDCVKGDFVSDTPIQQGPNFGKPVFPHITCNNGPNGDMFMNFADYVDDDAMYMFTKGQVLRMHETLQGPRKGLTQP
jgi:hypothetical protein